MESRPNPLAPYRWSSWRSRLRACFDVIPEEQFMQGCIDAAVNEIDDLRAQYTLLQSRFPSEPEALMPAPKRPRIVQTAMDDLWELQNDRKRDVRVFEEMRPDLARFLLLHSVPGLAASVPRMSVDMKVMTEMARGEILRARQFGSDWIRVADDLHRIWETTVDGRVLYTVRRWASFARKLLQAHARQGPRRIGRRLLGDVLSDIHCTGNGLKRL